MKYNLLILTLFCLFNLSCEKNINIDKDDTFKPHYVKFDYVVDQSFFNEENYTFYVSYNEKRININNINTLDSVYINNPDEKVYINIYYYNNNCSNVYEICLNVDKWSVEYKNILIGDSRFYQTDKITISDNPLQINIHKY